MLAPQRVWVAHFLGCLLMLECGLLYGWGNFSVSFLQRFNGELSQTAVNTVGSFGNIGLYLGLIGGLMYRRLGAPKTYLVGTWVTVAGYVMMWCSARRLFGASVPLMCVASFLMGQGRSITSTAACVSSCERLPGSFRAFALGSVLGAYSLCIAVWIPIFSALEIDEVASVSQLAAWNHSWKIFTLRDFSDIFLFLAVMVAVVGSLTSWAVSKAPIWTEIIAPLLMVEEEGDESFTLEQESTPLISGSKSPKLALIKGTGKEPTGRAIFHIASSPMFWLLFAILGCMSGGTLVVLANMGGIIGAAGAGSTANSTTSSTIAIFGAVNACGRVTFGAASDLLRTKAKAANFMMALFCAIGLLIGLGITYHAGEMYLSSVGADPKANGRAATRLCVIGILVTATGYSVLWVVIPVMMSRLVGMERFSLAGGMYTFSPSIAGFVLNYVAGRLVDRSSSLADGTYSPGSYQSTLLLCIGVTIARLPLIFILYLFMKLKKLPLL